MKTPREFLESGHIAWLRNGMSGIIWHKTLIIGDAKYVVSLDNYSNNLSYVGPHENFKNILEKFDVDIIKITTLNGDIVWNYNDLLNDVKSFKSIFPTIKYLARDSDGNLRGFSNKPSFTNSGIWFNGYGSTINLNLSSLQSNFSISSSDTEPFNIDEYLKENLE